MMMTVNNRFSILIAQKMMDDKKRVSLAEIARQTGIDQRTLGRWANNTITRYDVPVINALCIYFGCQPGDLFEYVPDNQPE